VIELGSGEETIQKENQNLEERKLGAKIERHVGTNRVSESEKGSNKVKAEAKESNSRAAGGRSRKLDVV